MGCKPVRVVVAVDETDAEDAAARALPAAELPALAQRYAAKVSSVQQETYAARCCLACGVMRCQETASCRGLYFKC